MISGQVIIISAKGSRNRSTYLIRQSTILIQSKYEDKMHENAVNLLDVVARESYVVEAKHSLGHGVVGRVDVHS